MAKPFRIGKRIMGVVVIGIGDTFILYWKNGLIGIELTCIAEEVL